MSSKSISKDRYEGLEYSEEFGRILEENPEKLKDICNGVGSKVGAGKLIYHFIPNTIYLLDITPASDIHDFDYTYPDKFDSLTEAYAYKRMADDRFYDNVLKLIDKHSSNPIIKFLRKRRAKEYFFALTEFGLSSFLKGKNFSHK